MPLGSKNILILGIETSCDETSIAVVKNGREVLSNIISSQIELHKEYGGVVPELASRKHIETIIPLIEKSLRKSKVQLDELDAVAVTYGPGLVGALLTGLSTAKGLAYGLNIPLIGVHHIEAHIYGNFLEADIEFPLLSLVVSGGHTHLVLVNNHSEFEILGHTLDDAAGEAFDKISRVLGLGYPGGPAIDRVAKDGNPDAIPFPRALMEDDSLNFSFSGLKSSVINHINRGKQRGEVININDIAASFQMAVVDVLTEKVRRTIERYDIKAFALAGGVAANSLLRDRIKKLFDGRYPYFIPPMEYCTDNGAMIACRGYYLYKEGISHSLDLNAVPYLPIGSK